MCNQYSIAYVLYPYIIIIEIVNINYYFVSIIPTYYTTDVVLWCYCFISASSHVEHSIIVCIVLLNTYGVYLDSVCVFKTFKTFESCHSDTPVPVVNATHACGEL